uniref:Uncharacterized protein n=1 Tax=Anguilla anguilla TaxID=7936 RepID=A0A0E9QUL2_ANGAN
MQVSHAFITRMGLLKIFYACKCAWFVVVTMLNCATPQH